MYIPPALLAPRKDAFRFHIREMVSSWDRRAFVRAPWRLYRGDPYWVPPLISERSALLDRRHNPFLRSVEVALFCAEASSGISLEEVVGTIAVWSDARKNEASGEATGCFGLFETINHEEVAAALLARAEEWLHEHLPGMEIMRGPASLNPAHTAGVLVDGFNAPPAVMMPYGAPFYPEMIEAAGFEASEETLALRLALSDVATDRASLVSDCRRRIKQIIARYGVAVHTCDPQSLQENSGWVKEVCDVTWAAAEGLSPLTNEEFAWLAKSFARYLDPRFCVMVERSGEPVALSIGLPDVAAALRWANGRLLPLGWLPYEIRRRRTARLLVFPPLAQPDGSPEIGRLLRLELIGRAAAHGYRSIEFAPIPADDQTVGVELAQLGARIAKRYRMYEKRYSEEW